MQLRNLQTKVYYICRVTGTDENILQIAIMLLKSITYSNIGNSLSKLTFSNEKWHQFLMKMDKLFKVTQDDLSVFFLILFWAKTGIFSVHVLSCCINRCSSCSVRVISNQCCGSILQRRYSIVP